MLSIILFAACVGLSSQQSFSTVHGEDLRKMVDLAFSRVDTNNDGILSIQEIGSVAAMEDANHDGFVNLEEYVKFTHQSQAVATPMFYAYDFDNDGLLPTNHMSEFLHLLDADGNGEVHMDEFEHYQMKLINCVYSDHGFGYGAAKPCVMQAASS
ncbi:hypothetical protein ACF0H5_022026 [Mactra antiquata]